MNNLYYNAIKESCNGYKEDDIKSWIENESIYSDQDEPNKLIRKVLEMTEEEFEIYRHNDKEDFDNEWNLFTDAEQLLLSEFERDLWHKRENHKMIDPGSPDWKLAEKYKLQHPTYSENKILIKEVWRDPSGVLCVQYETAFEKKLDWFHYLLNEKNNDLEWW